MRDFFKEVFEYHHHFNQQLISDLIRHKNALPDKTYSLFCHVLNAHQFWNSRILNLAALGVHDVHPGEILKDIDYGNYRDTHEIINSKNLSETITYSNSRGEQFTNTIQDILFHVSNHSTHHKGQIVADFRSRDIVPLVTDYIFYKRRPLE